MWAKTEGCSSGYLDFPNCSRGELPEFPSLFVGKVACRYHNFPFCSRVCLLSSISLENSSLVFGRGVSGFFFFFLLISASWFLTGGFFLVVVLVCISGTGRVKRALFVPVPSGGSRRRVRCNLLLSRLCLPSLLRRYLRS